MAAVKIPIRQRQRFGATVNVLSYRHRYPFSNIRWDSPRQLCLLREIEAVKQTFTVVKICKHSAGYEPPSPRLKLMLLWSVVNWPGGGNAKTVIPLTCSLPVDRHRGLFVRSSNESISVMLTLLFSADGWSTSHCLCFYLARWFMPFILPGINRDLFGWQTARARPRC